MARESEGKRAGCKSRRQRVARESRTRASSASVQGHFLATRRICFRTPQSCSRIAELVLLAASDPDPTLARQIPEISQANIPEVSGVLCHAFPMQADRRTADGRRSKPRTISHHVLSPTPSATIPSASITTHDNHIHSLNMHPIYSVRPRSSPVSYQSLPIVGRPFVSQRNRDSRARDWCSL